MKPERMARILVAFFLLLLIVGPVLSNGVDLLVDWLWFNQEGFRVLYINTLKAQITLGGYAGTVFLLVVGLNLLLARSLAHRSRFRVYQEVIEFPSLDRFSSIIRWAIWLGIVVVGFFVSEWATSYWKEFLLAQHGIPVGQADPLFGIEVSFYLFRLPFIWFLYHLVLFTLVICLLSAVFLYLVEGGVSVTPRGPDVSRPARAHMVALCALIFVVMA